MEPNDEQLRKLLQSARPAPNLPARFQEGVWRRIEGREAAVAKVSALSRWPDWLDQWVERLLQPRLALASLALLLTAGGLTGLSRGAAAAKQHAQERYLAAVAPDPLH